MTCLSTERHVRDDSVLSVWCRVSIRVVCRARLASTAPYTAPSENDGKRSSTRQEVLFSRGPHERGMAQRMRHGCPYAGPLRRDVHGTPFPSTLPPDRPLHSPAAGKLRISHQSSPHHCERGPHAWREVLTAFRGCSLQQCAPFASPAAPRRDGAPPCPSSLQRHPLPAAERFEWHVHATPKPMRSCHETVV